MDKSKYKERLSRVIQQYLTDYNVSRTVFAEEIGVERDAVDKWVRGASFPRLSNLKVLEEFFDIELIPRYAFYKGEELLAIGTVEEIAKATGKTYERIRWFTFPSAYEHKLKHRYKENIYHLVDLGAD